ncbi:hypothetical protein QZN08_00005, partial [Burkholderia multivorans]|nr:hypothetical protein [Burkholderia multivorans]
VDRQVVDTRLEHRVRKLAGFDCRLGTGADGRPAAGGRGTRAVLRLPVARIAVQPAAASHHT